LDYSSLFDEFVNWAFLARVGHFTHKRVEYNVFLFDEPLKGFKSLKTFKISLTFRFDKLWHLLKSAHIGENSQILTVSNKKIHFFYNRQKTWHLCIVIKLQSFSFLLMWKNVFFFHTWKNVVFICAFPRLQWLVTILDTLIFFI
jgi:hypothetical protein